METYRVIFRGRKIGSKKGRKWHTIYVLAKDVQDASIRLYDLYDGIDIFSIDKDVNPQVMG